MPVRVDAALDGLVVPKLDNPRGTSSQLHLHLRRLINDGAIAPGTELNQADLARRFDVSRIPMREAFRMLQQNSQLTAWPYAHQQPGRPVHLVRVDAGNDGG